MKDIKIRLNNRLNYVKGLIHSNRHYKCNRAINSLYRFLNKNHIYATVKNIYSMAEQEEDDTQDELADEGGIFYYSEASNEVDGLIDKFEKSGNAKQFKYWNKVKNDLKFCNCYLVIYKSNNQLQARLPNEHDALVVMKFVKHEVEKNLSRLEKRDHFLDNRYIVINGTDTLGSLILYSFDGLSMSSDKSKCIYNFQNAVSISSINDLRVGDSWNKHFFMTKDQVNHLYNFIAKNYGSLMKNSAKYTTVKAKKFIKDLK